MKKSKASSSKPGKIVFRADVNHTKSLIKIGEKSAARAVKETKAMGLPVTFLENGNIIKESPDGTRVILGTV